MRASTKTKPNQRNGPFEGLENVNSYRGLDDWLRIRNDDNKNTVYTKTERNSANSCLMYIQNNSGLHSTVTGRNAKTIVKHTPESYNILSDYGLKFETWGKRCIYLENNRSTSVDYYKGLYIAAYEGYLEGGYTKSKERMAQFLTENDPENYKLTIPENVKLIKPETTKQTNYLDQIPTRTNKKNTTTNDSKTNRNIVDNRNNEDDGNIVDHRNNVDDGNNTGSSVFIKGNEKPVVTKKEPVVTKKEPVVTKKQQQKQQQEQQQRQEQVITEEPIEPTTVYEKDISEQSNELTITHTNLHIVNEVNEFMKNNNITHDDKIKGKLCDELQKISKMLINNKNFNDVSKINNIISAIINELGNLSSLNEALDYIKDKYNENARLY